LKRFFFIPFFILAAKIAIAQLTFPNLQVQYDSAWVCNHYQLIPIVFTPNAIHYNLFPKQLLTLQQALQQKKLVIKENYFDGNDNVNSLFIKNISKQPILLLDGELLKGGKQDRMIAETKVVYPNETNELELVNVFCIEKGRWSKNAKKFSSAGFASNNIRKMADSTKTQQQVWREIEKQFEQYQVPSATFPYLELQKQLPVKDTSCYNYFVQKFKNSITNYAGFIAMHDTTIIGTDVFANPTLTRTAFENVLSSYMQMVFPVKDSVMAVSKQKINEFTDKLFSTENNQKKFIEHHGNIFYNNKKPVHLVAYGY
jgi:hypothetical protein